MRAKVIICGIMYGAAIVMGGNAFAYSPYFSIGGGYYDSRVSVSRGTASVSSNGLSLSAVAGMRLNQYFSTEINAHINQLRIQGAADKSDLTFIGIMPGVRMGTRIMRVFYPYIGASIGPSFVINEYNAPTGDTRHTSTTLSYQGRVGMMLNIGAGAGLDIGVRYVSQGRLKIDGTDFGIDGNVTSFNYYITASYGF